MNNWIPSFCKMANNNYIVLVIVVVIILVFGVCPRWAESLAVQPSENLVMAPMLKIPPRYIFNQGIDSIGSNIKHVKELAGNIPALKGACDALPHCQGFNTQGWLKYALQPEGQWKHWTYMPHQGLYTKVW